MLDPENPFKAPLPKLKTNLFSDFCQQMQAATISVYKANTHSTSTARSFTGREWDETLTGSVCRPTMTKSPSAATFSRKSRNPTSVAKSRETIPMSRAA